MKHTCIIFLLIILVTGLISCDDNTSFEKPVSFYYPLNSVTYGESSGVLDYEKRESADYTNNHSALINLYLLGPQSDGLYNPFPQNTTARSFTITDDGVIIELSAEFASLSGLEHSLAVASLSKTIQKITNSPKITIITEGVAEPLVILTDELMFNDFETAPPTIKE